MEEKDKKEPIFKTPNDIHTIVTIDDKETVLDETGCTTLSIILKNTGDIATSFLGAHSPEIINLLAKASKRYLKVLKKQVKGFVEDNIEVNKDTPNPTNDTATDIVKDENNLEKPKSKVAKTKANKIAKQKTQK